MKKYKEQNIKSKEYNNKFLNKCSKLLYNIDNWPIIAIIFSIPLIVVLVCILVLFGQRPDEAIKAFLETSDWTLSTKISPPSITYQADITYILMKPLEWIFLLVLYIFDVNPENRIVTQYIGKKLKLND